jgi:hypothetical protein
MSEVSFYGVCPTARFGACRSLLPRRGTSHSLACRSGWFLHCLVNVRLRPTTVHLELNRPLAPIFINRISCDNCPFKSLLCSAPTSDQ